MLPHIKDRYKEKFLALYDAAERASIELYKRDHNPLAVRLDSKGMSFTFEVEKRAKVSFEVRNYDHTNRLFENHSVPLEGNILVKRTFRRSKGVDEICIEAEPGFSGEVVIQKGKSISIVYFNSLSNDHLDPLIRAHKFSVAKDELLQIAMNYWEEVAQERINKVALGC